MELISMSKTDIDKMNKSEVLDTINKLTFEPVYTDETWKLLNKRLDAINNGE